MLLRAGDAALARFQRMTPSTKSDGSEVTEADLAAEEILVEALLEEFPGYGIVAEEGTHVEGTEGTWYVDPIDGTSAFLEGLAYWGPTACLVRDGRLEAGALWLPRLRELWYAAAGRGAFRDEVRLAPPPLEHVGRNASLYAPSGFHRGGPIAWPGKVRALGSTAAHLAHAASGGAALALVAKWAAWDIGCGLLLVREAGRAIADLTGAPIDPMHHPNRPFLAGAPLAIQTLTRAAAPR